MMIPRWSCAIRRPAALAAAAALALFVAAPVAAQDAEEPPSPAPEADVAVSTEAPEALPASGLDAAGPELTLTLDDAIAVALQRNLGLLVQRYEREQFRLLYEESLGIYDFDLGAAAFLSEETSPTTSAIEGAEVITREQANLNLGGSQLFPWGGVGSAEFNVFRQEDNSRNSTFSPFFATDLDLGYTQPLLRNFGRTATERGIRVARINSEISRESFEEDVATTIQQVDAAYWTLVEARAQLEVAEESLGLARELHDMNRVRVEVGTLAPLELIQSEAGIAIREEEIIRARAAMQDAEDELRRLLALEEGGLWGVQIVPATDPETARVDVDLETAIATALAERPELRGADLSIEALEIDAAYFRNQRLPRLDLSARYGYNGLGGDIIIRDEQGNVVNTIEGGFSDAIDQLSDMDFDGWRVDLVFAYPLQNRAARARSAFADLEVEQGRARRAETELGIRTEVRAAVRAVGTAAQQIDSASASVRLAEQNLEAERRRYENGLSTSFQVLEIQEDLTAARSRLVSAVASYRRALAEYYQATGQLLESQGVELIDPLRVE